MKADVDYMDSKHLSDLKIWEDEITSTISNIKQKIINVKELYDSNDICRVCEYISENVIFKSFSPKRTASLPKFIFHQIDREEICQQFGFLLELNVRVDTYIKNPISSDVVSSPLMDIPRILSDIATDFEHTNKLCHVTYVSNREIWIGGLDGFIRLYILRGARFRSIKTKSGNVPYGIAFIRVNDLVYADCHDRSLNIVKLTGNTCINTLIRLQGWKPRGVCSTSSDDLLVFMVNDTNTQSKVVRYSCSTEKQTIQYDDRGKPPYSSSGSSDSSTFLCENKNFDICVADNNANAVVVVDQNGDFRFRYTP